MNNATFLHSFPNSLQEDADLYLHDAFRVRPWGRLTVLSYSSGRRRQTGSSRELPAASLGGPASRGSSGDLCSLPGAFQPAMAAAVRTSRTSLADGRLLNRVNRYAPSASSCSGVALRAHYPASLHALRTREFDPASGIPPPARSRAPRGRPLSNRLPPLHGRR